MKAVEAVFTDEDPMVRLMAFGVQQALKKEIKANDYHELLRRTRSDGKVSEVVRVRVFCNQKDTNVYVDYNTTVPDVIDQIVWSRGLNEMDEYDLYGESSQGDVLLIGHAACLLAAVLERRGEFEHFVLRRKFSRLMKDEREKTSETTTSYVNAIGLYRQGKYKHEDSIATQLCLFQIIADGEEDVLNDITVLSQRIGKYFPQKVSPSAMTSKWLFRDSQIIVPMNGTDVLHISTLS